MLEDFLEYSNVFLLMKNFLVVLKFFWGGEGYFLQSGTISGLLKDIPGGLENSSGELENFSCML